MTVGPGTDILTVSEEISGAEAGSDPAESAMEGRNEEIIIATRASWNQALLIVHHRVRADVMPSY
jgi:hypothetical protein